MTAVRPVETFVTARFKMRTSARQRVILADTTARLDRAYKRALAAALAHLEAAPEAKRFDLHEAARKAVLPEPVPNGSKNSLAIDAAAQAASFRELKTVDHIVPTAPTAGEGRPILHFMWGKAAGWMMLRRPRDGAVYLYLVASPADSRFARRIDLSGLACVRTGEIISGGSSVGLLFPLEFGRFQQRRFLDQGRPQSLKVFARDDHWWADVTFRREAEPVAASGVVALYQSPAIAAAMVALSPDGLREEEATFLLPRGPLTQEVISETHRISNVIVAVATRRRAAIALPTRDGVAEWMRHGPTGPAPVLSSRVDRIARQVAYKAGLAGLPCTEMHTAGTLSLCPFCAAPAVDLDEGDWSCPGCRMKRPHADQRKAHALGLKFLWRQSQPPAHRKKTLKEDAEPFHAFIRHKNMAGAGLRPGSSAGLAEDAA